MELTSRTHPPTLEIDPPDFFRYSRQLYRSPLFIREQHTGEKQHEQADSDCPDLDPRLTRRNFMAPLLAVALA